MFWVPFWYRQTFFLSKEEYNENKKIQHCLNISKILQKNRKKRQIDTTKTHIQERSLSWLGTGIQIKVIEIIDNHKLNFSSLGMLPLKTRNVIFPQGTGYCILNLHRCAYNQRYIVEAAMCSTIHLSKLLTFLLTAVKIGLLCYNVS